MRISTTKYPSDPFGRHWTTKNKFQEYFYLIVKAYHDEDWEYIKQLMEELTPEQQWKIWWSLASYTRKAMKEHGCADLEIV